MSDGTWRREDGRGEPAHEKARRASPTGLHRFSHRLDQLGGYFFRVYVTVNMGSFPAPTYMLISMVSLVGIRDTDRHFVIFPSMPGASPTIVSVFFFAS